MTHVWGSLTETTDMYYSTKLNACNFAICMNWVLGENSNVYIDFFLFVILEMKYEVTVSFLVMETNQNGWNYVFTVSYVLYKSIYLSGGSNLNIDFQCIHESVLR